MKGGDKPSMHDKESMKVVTIANDSSKVVGLKTNFVVDIAIMGVVEYARRTRSTPTNIGSTSKGVGASLVDHWATSNVDVVKLYGNISIIAGEISTTHYALANLVIRIGGW